MLFRSCGRFHEVKAHDMNEFLLSYLVNTRYAIKSEEAHVQPLSAYVLLDINGLSTFFGTFYF